MSPEQTTYDVFFSYNTQDHLAVETIARYLHEQGLRVFLDRWYLNAGMPWPEHLESVLANCGAVAVFLGPNGVGRWQQREKELALDRQARERMFPVIPVLLPHADPPLGFLSLNTWVDLGNGIHDAAGLAALTGAVRGLPPGPDASSAGSISPYRGLRHFREEDAALFFGRDILIEQLAEEVGRKPVVALVGASGSGKSSVVRAGLLPRLRSRRGDRVWEIVTMIPGDRPMHALAGALMPLLEPRMSDTDRLAQTGRVREDLDAGRTRVRDLVALALRNQPGTDRLLLVIDQAEELYTAATPEVLRRFVEDVLDACTAAPLTVVLTLRADFMNEVLGTPQLAQRVRDGIVYVTPMTAEDLRQVIEFPALRTGLSFEPGLVQRIVDEVEGRPGDLPLLEFVLAQLWERRTGRGMLTHEAYEAIGEVEGAIATHADRVLAGFSSDEQAMARRILLQLVRPALPSRLKTQEERATDPYVRRRASFGELGPGTRPVILKLADAHLIVTGRNEATGQEIVDLVHEALIEKWKTLRDWVDADRPFLVWREQLRTLQSFGRGDEVVLLNGHLLRESRRWLRERAGDLTPDQREYIAASANARRNQISMGVAALVIVVLTIGGLAFLSLNLWTPFGETTDSGRTDVSNTIDTTAYDDTEEEPDPSRTATELQLPPLANVVIPAKPVTIPVVVHVLYKEGAENITDAQVRSQIAALNRDFRARNDDRADVPSQFRSLVADAKIEFALATTDPQGQPTNGITRTHSPYPVFTPSMDDDRMASRVKPGWPSDHYLNIWVCNLDGVPGYAWPPGARRDLDGIVINYKSFGTVGDSLSVDSRLGRVTVRNAGHWLGLEAISGTDPSCDDDDGIADTPRQAGPNFNRPAFPQPSCDGSPSMFMNYMDYTDDDIRVMFTKGQVKRMHQVLQGPRRALLGGR
jgi:type II secretory pathway predicted ATPase ExeA